MWNAIAGGGDRWLFTKLLVDGQGECSSLSGYEDRERWVRDLLNLETEQELVLAIKNLIPKGATLLSFGIGQEEEPSTGFPIRFIKVLYRFDK